MHRTNSWVEIPDEFTCSISDSVSLRVYADTRPNNGKIADLQKGLILVLNSAELVGEGTGFGVPIIKGEKNTFFSGTSQVFVSHQGGVVRIRKEYSMDRVSRETFGNARLENRQGRLFIDYLSALYQKHRHLRFLSLKNLFSRLGVHARFVSVSSIGKVIVSYILSDKKIHVNADFGSLQLTGLKTLFLLNEQSSKFFRNYSDSNGSEFSDSHIGAWEDVTADWASFLGFQGSVGFRLEKVENSILRRGREFLQNSMDWVGLDYEVTRETRVFQFDISILEADLNR
jgi:hypothetical protein